MRSGPRRMRAFAVMVTLLALQPSVGALAQVQPTIDCSRTSTGAVPLTDLGTGTYEGAQGGLYPGGSNEPPPDHAALGLWQASQIEPLDSSGVPDPKGAVVLISIGVSNTKQEFNVFRQEARNATAPAVVIVNGAQGGEPIESWLGTDAATWDTLDDKLDQFNVTPEQVQVAWVMLPERILGLDSMEPFPLDAETYQEDLTNVIRSARDRYPNLRIAYLSSRIYGGYNTSGRPSPEPLAYQHGFGVKWTIEDQINGNPDLNADPRRGDIEAPWLAWGPYLWADGTTPRSDGLIWECTDVRSDGTHPSDRGTEKVGAMLLDHFFSDPTAAPWFAPGAEPIGAVDLPPLSGATATTTTVAPTTTQATTTTTTTVAPSTTTTATGSRRADEAPAREGRRPDRQAAAPQGGDSSDATVLLGGTAVALALALAIAALVGRSRRKPD